MIHDNLGRNLLSAIGDTNGGSLEFKEVVRVAIQMVSAVWFVAQKGGGLGVGLENFFWDGGKVRMSLTPVEEREMDWRYMAPEGLTGREEQKSLVFSLGCIIAELLINRRVIQGENRREYVNCINSLFPTQQLQSILNDPPAKLEGKSFVESISEVCSYQPMIELLGLMVKVNPNERISFEEVQVRLRHIDFKIH